MMLASDAEARAWLAGLPEADDVALARLERLDHAGRSGTTNPMI